VGAGQGLEKNRVHHKQQAADKSGNTSMV